MARILPTLLSAVLLCGCSNAPPRIVEAPEGLPPQSLVPSSFDYRVGPGDVLRVNVFEHPDLSSPLLGDGSPGSPVLGDGTVLLPLVGSIPAAGATVAEIGKRVEESLLRYMRDPRVDVAVVKYEAHRVFVMGEVQVPGSYPLERPTTVMEALTLARGFGPYANRDQIAWISGGLVPENMVFFNGNQIDPVAAQHVRAGDLIFVGRRRWADEAQAAGDVLPFLALITQPLIITIQAVTLASIL